MRNNLIINIAKTVFLGIIATALTALVVLGALGIKEMKTLNNQEEIIIPETENIYTIKFNEKLKFEYSETLDFDKPEYGRTNGLNIVSFDDEEKDKTFEILDEGIGVILSADAEYYNYFETVVNIDVEFEIDGEKSRYRILSYDSAISRTDLTFLNIEAEEGYNENGINLIDYIPLSTNADFYQTMYITGSYDYEGHPIAPLKDNELPFLLEGSTEDNPTEDNKHLFSIHVKGNSVYGNNLITGETIAL